MQPANVSGTNDGPNSITRDQRDHSVHRLVQALFPTPDPSAMLNLVHMYNLVVYTKKVEMDVYEMVHSRSEYYLVLAEKISEIQTGLEDTRQKLRQHGQMAQNRSGIASATATTPQQTSSSRPNQTHTMESDLDQNSCNVIQQVRN